MTINFNLNATTTNLDTLTDLIEALEALNEFMGWMNEHIGRTVDWYENSVPATKEQTEWIKNLLPYADRMDLKNEQFDGEWIEWFKSELESEWEDIEKTIDNAFHYTGEENRKEIEKLVKAIKG